MNKINSIKSLKETFLNPYRNMKVGEEESWKSVLTGPVKKDFTARTVKGIKSEEMLLSALGLVAKEMQAYFNGKEIEDQESFDEWHNKTCKAFLNEFHDKSGNVKIEYGKAQKVVNMAFKYSYCFDNIADHMGKLKFCHMPLDKYTLEDWFKKDVIRWYNKNNTQKKVLASSILSWSKLEFGYNEEKGTYIWIQKTIRDFLNSAENTCYKTQEGEILTPLQAEFYIWDKNRNG